MVASTSLTTSWYTAQLIMNLNQHDFFFRPLCTRDIHLNPDKVKIDCHEVPFFGNILSKDGLSPDTKKVELIQQWPTPTNQKELQSILGTVNYLS